MTSSGCKILHQLVIGIIRRREAEGGGGHGSLWDGLGQTGYPRLNREWEEWIPGPRMRELVMGARFPWRNLVLDVLGREFWPLFFRMCRRIVGYGSIGLREGMTTGCKITSELG